MNNLARDIMFLGIGGTVGASITYFILKKNYVELIDKEVKSIENTYKKRYETPTKENFESVDKNVAAPIDKNDQTEYNNISSNYRLKTTDLYSKRKEEKNSMYGTSNKKKPYIIAPEEFGETGYESVFLTLYADGVLQEDLHQTIIGPNDVDDLIGEDNLSEIGRYEDDILHIRNDTDRLDYEITQIDRGFSEVNNDADK